MGNGRRGTFSAPNGGGNIPYNNRELDAGTIYYFFIRLYSSVVSHVFGRLGVLYYGRVYRLLQPRKLCMWFLLCKVRAVQDI